ncbi:hypothetical protein RBB50_000268 [Rhinocladiella similis]
MASTTKNPRAIEAAKLLNHVPWCEDYERMISGMAYNQFAPELRDGRLRARRLAKKYTDYFPDEATSQSLAENRQKMLEVAFGRIGPNATVEGPYGVDYGCNISIGSDFYANFNLVILDCGLVTIGDRVFLGPSVAIFAATHETDVQSRRDGIDFSRQVTIGNDCWIGGGTIVLPGVTIGDGCTIGCGSVVTRDIPPFSVAVGSPARVIKTVVRVEELKRGDSLFSN